MAMTDRNRALETIHEIVTRLDEADPEASWWEDVDLLLVQFHHLQQSLRIGETSRRGGQHTPAMLILTTREDPQWDLLVTLSVRDPDQEKARGFFILRQKPDRTEDRRTEAHELLRKRARQWLRATERLPAATAERPEQPAGPATPKREASPSGKLPAEARHHQRVRDIVAAWRTHHGQDPHYYNSDPMTITAAAAAWGINRRTLGRTADTLFGCSEGDGWSRYESLCQRPTEFLKWLDIITDPGAALRNLAPAPEETPKCTSCGSPSDSLVEWQGQDLCPECHGQTEDGQT